MTQPTKLFDLGADALVEMYELDATALGGEMYRFTLHDFYGQPVVWQGNSYVPYPIQASGFEIRSNAALPRPTMAVSNVGGFIGAICRATDDLIGAKVTRIRTFKKYLDDVNFADVARAGTLAVERASVGTYWSAAGVLTTALADAGRFDHDPLSSNAATGLLIEEARTNHVTNNTMVGAIVGVTNLPTNWLGSLGTLNGVTFEIVALGTDNGIDYVDFKVSGTATAGGGSRAIIAHTVFPAAVAGETWSTSVFTKLVAGTLPILAERPQVQLIAYDAGGFAQESVTSALNFAAGSLNQQRNDVTMLLADPDSTQVAVAYVYNITGGVTYNYTFRIGLPQLEKGVMASSPIKTNNTGAMTRQADRVYVTSEWLKPTGTFVAQYQGGHDGAGYGRAISITNSSSGAVELLGSGGSQTTVQSSDATTSISKTDGAANVWTTATLAGVCWDGAGASISLRGSATTSTATPLNFTPTNGRVTFGGNDGSRTNMLNGHIRKLTYYERRVSNSELLTLTGGGSIADTPRFSIDLTTGSLATSIVAPYNPTANPAMELPREVWRIDRRSAENRESVAFELAAPWDVAGVKLPRRIVVQNSCTWQYRSSECGYAGGPVATETDAPTSNSLLDKCGKRISSCKLRFGEFAELPFGGFPSVGQTTARS